MKIPTITTGGDASPRDNDDTNEMFFAKRGWCSWLPCFGSDPSPSSPSYGSIGWESMRTPDNNEKCCWTRGWMKIREWSEKVAGPKWKTLIRRFHRNRNHGYTKQGKFQYDPLSYSLNFDEGKGQKSNSDDDNNFRDFSTRYAAIPASAKSSTDLGKDGPTLSRVVG
ncbi:hypothetical protein L6164_005158 [Bauhinia variegata]|uniref:Uncharacterized protein n=1 Tax=Bauhinia variegata TaxID=167791 RepID=A0ACB9PVV6_BAUVA|nr:hypothetical protein L6164_005158 [Bauhinia variegata]